MKKIRYRIAAALGDDRTRNATFRPRVRREPMCESLEGRQLLSTAASAMASGMPPWGGPGSFPGGSGTPPSAAQIAHFDGKGGPGGFTGMGGADFAHSGKGGSFTPKAMSATLKADLSALQSDEAQLQSELPSSVTSALTADQAVISKALSSMPKPTQNARSMTPPTWSSSDPSAGMTTMLEKAGISASEATQIATDFQTYQTDLQTTDPTLQATITADKTAISSAGGPTLPTGDVGMGFPGPPMNGAPTA